MKTILKLYGGYMNMIVDVPDDLRDKLEQRAKKIGSSMSYIIKDAIYRYMKEEE